MTCVDISGHYSQQTKSQQKQGALFQFWDVPTIFGIGRKKFLGHQRNKNHLHPVRKPLLLSLGWTKPGTFVWCLSNCNILGHAFPYIHGCLKFGPHVAMVHIPEFSYTCVTFLCCGFLVHIWNQINLLFQHCLKCKSVTFINNKCLYNSLIQFSFPVLQQIKKSTCFTFETEEGQKVNCYTTICFNGFSSVVNRVRGGKELWWQKRRWRLKYLYEWR